MRIKVFLPGSGNIRFREWALEPQKLMTVYRIHFLNHGGHCYATEYFACEDDQTAVDRAHRLNVPGIGYGFELWQNDRLVYAHPKKSTT